MKGIPNYAAATSSNAGAEPTAIAGTSPVAVTSLNAGAERS